jgi:hypothetical protein
MFKKLSRKFKLLFGLMVCETAVAGTTVSGCTDQLQQILNQLGTVTIDFSQIDLSQFL